MAGFASPGRERASPEKGPEPGSDSIASAGGGGENAFEIATRSGGIGLQRLPGTTEGGPFGSIVEDDVEPGPGQIRRTEFVTKAVSAIESVATSELARFGKTAKDCPYLEYYVRYYRDKPAAHIERMIARYARPEAADPASLLKAMEERVRKAIVLWAATGKVELPDVASGASGGSAAPVLGFEGPVAAADPQAVRARLGAGHSLDSPTRSRMERGFGREFGDVRVHSDAAAGRAATSLSARAFTIGSDVGFGAGQYRPGTIRGDLMLAHELAHVVQQGGGGAAPQAFLSSSDGALEADADQAALDAVLPGLRGAGDAAERLPSDFLPPPWHHRAEEWLHSPPGAPRAHSGLKLQRCGGPDPDLSNQPSPPDYDTVVAELRALYEKKAALVASPPADIEAKRKDIDEKIAVQVAKLRLLGVLAEEDAIAKAVTGAGGAADLRRIHGKISRTPEGDTFEGQKMTFRLYQDYLPPGRSVHLLWRWRDKDSKEYDIALGSGRYIRGESFTLDDLFWNWIHPREKFQVFCEVRLGDTDSAVVDKPSTDWIQLSPPPTSKLEIEGSTKIAITDAPVIFQIKGLSLQLQDHLIEWHVDGKEVEKDVLVLKHEFGSTGTKTITAKIYKVKRGFWGPTKTFMQEASTTVDVKTAAEVGESALAEAAKGQTPVGLKELEQSITETLPHIAIRAKQGGEQAKYWKGRYEAQEERRKGITSEVPFFKHPATRALPPDPTTLDPATKYTAPIPTVIVYPKHGVQPIQVYLSVEFDSGAWQAKLIDATGKKVIHFKGSGSAAPLTAIRNAFDDWKDDNPYPKEGTVSYTFNPPGWTFPKSFSTYRFGKAVEDFIDSVLAVGGFILAGLLLSAPEATITKVLGLALLGLGLARSTVQIFKNVDLGYDLLDKENVLEGLNIVTAFLGVGGTFMRSLGAEVRAVRPLVYRLGNVMVMGSLTADVGTLVFATSEAYEQIKAAQGDPTMDEAARNAQILRVISNLLMSGTLVFVSNRSLFKNMKGSDFLKGRLPTSDTVEIGKATRLDLELELRKAGQDPTALRAMGDRELLGAFLLEQRKQAAVKKVDDLRSSLSDPAKEQLDAMRAGHDPEPLAKAIEDLRDPKTHFEALAAEAEKRRKAATPPEKPPGAETAAEKKARLQAALEAKKLADKEKAAAQLQEQHKRDVADAEKRGLLPPAGSDDRKWLDADPTGRRKELAYDPPQDKFRVREARAALEAELNGQPTRLDPPVRRSAAPGKKETGVDYLDGKGAEWDHVQLTDPATARAEVERKAYPKRTGAQGENAIADCLDLSPGDAKKLMDDWSKGTHPAGTGKVVFVLPP